MISITAFQSIIAEFFFDNNMEVAGLIMYIAALGLFFLISKNITAVLVMALPMTLIFASLGILTGDLLIVMIIITVIGLGLSAKGLISG